MHWHQGFAGCLMSGWASKLTRITTTGRYIAELDGLRFIAIAAVFLQHVQQTVIANASAQTPLQFDTFSRAIERMRFGVELFFAISGFILGLPFASYYLKGEKKVSLKKYFLRRLTRLEPPYLINLGCCFLLLILCGHSWSSLLPHLGASALYSHNIIYGEFSLINSVAWSLEVEVQFYILAPVIAVIYGINGRYLRRGAFCLLGFIVFVLRHTLESRWGPLPVTLLSSLPYFLVGMILADLYIVNWREAPQSKWYWDFAVIPGWIMLPAIFLRTLPAMSLVSSLLLFVLVYGSFQSRLFLHFLRAAPIRIAGGMCYTIYLVHLAMLGQLHWAVISGFGTGKVSVATMASMVTLSACVLPVVLIMFVLVERPCMRRNWPADLLRFIRSGFDRKQDAEDG